MRRAIFALALCAAGCKGLPDACNEYSGRTCISLAVSLAGNGPTSIDAIQIVPITGLTLGMDKPTRSLPNNGATALPLLVAILPQSLNGAAVTIEVRGLLGGNMVGHGIYTAMINSGDHVSGSVALEQFYADMAMPDFAPGPDLVPPPCDPVAQTNCPVNQKCVLSGGQPTCTNAGNVAAGASCTTSPDNCVPGGYCFGYSGGVTACELYCNDDSDCQAKIPANSVSTSDVSYCYFTLNGGSGCTNPCNPLLSAVASSGCPSGTKCDSHGLYRGDAGVSAGDFTYCESAGAGGDGATCTKDTDCAAGYLCISTATAGTYHCRPYCRKATNSDCPNGSGYTCGNISGATWIGVCCPTTGC